MQYPECGLHHSLFASLPVDGHLEYFHLITIRSYTTLTTLVCDSLLYVLASLWKYLGSIPESVISLEEGMAAHSSVLDWGIPMDRGAWGATVHGVAESQTWLKRLSTHTHALGNLITGSRKMYILYFDRCCQSYLKTFVQFTFPKMSVHFFTLATLNSIKPFSFH